MMLKGNNPQVIGVDVMNEGLYYSSDQDNKPPLRNSLNVRLLNQSRDLI